MNSHLIEQLGRENKLQSRHRVLMSITQLDYDTCWAKVIHDEGIYFVHNHTSYCHKTCCDLLIKLTALNS